MSQTRLIRDTSGHKVTTLELFFDLVFVYGISQVTAYLAYDHSALGFFRGLLLAALLWWAWVAYSWLGTSVRIDRGLVQTAMFVAMGAIMVLALLMPDFFDETRGASVAMIAAAAYVVVRIMHLLLFYLAGRDDPGIVKAVLALARTVVIAAVLLIGGAYLGGTWQLILVAAAVAIDVIGPFLGRGEGWRLALGHFAERHALIVIIALGEGIVAIGVGAAGLPITPALLATALLGVALACVLWMCYFDGASTALEEAVEERSGVDRVTTARDVYSILHFLLVSGLILVALAMKSALKSADYGWQEPLAGYAAFALGLGAVQFLGGLWLMRRRAGARTSVGEPLLALAAALLVPVGMTLPAMATIAVTVVLALGWRAVRAG
ncbi:MAG: low temperature requirement protein A [Candidatus Nanopelagicales bacterium]|nr:low temperature requirement protein A [Actinomycetota bacterium]HNE89138.1 low temperature requirement protein A [Actinomycetota bacterium]HNL52056.1 low temperature requirement protein A [Actinomycetota bacterium]HNO14788.1 low temperature requirement protein A [Actinomycetota bacterium]HUM86006.1 low temperature requirement protein A [Actinomycetota bacterium]